MATQAETLFKNRVKRDLNDLRLVIPVFYFKTQEIARRGIPDILMCVNGWFVALELKTADGKFEPLQEHRLEKIRAAGGLGFVVTPERWEQIREIIAGLQPRVL